MSDLFICILVLRRSVMIKGQYIYGHISITSFCQKMWKYLSDIRELIIIVSEYCIDPNSYMVGPMGPRQLSLFPVAGTMRKGNTCICLYGFKFTRFYCISDLHG